MLLTRKLKNLKNFYLKVNVYKNQPQINVFFSGTWIRLAVKNMNNIRSQKYGYAIEEKAIESKRFW